MGHTQARYDSVNVIDPLKLLGSGTTERCDSVGVGVTLLEEMSHWTVGFEVSHMLECVSDHSVLPEGQDVGPLAPSPALCVPRCYQAAL